MLRQFYITAAAAGLIFMSGCTAVGPTLLTPDQQTRQRAEDFVRADDVGGALQLYADLIAASVGAAKADYLMAGTQLLIDSGDTNNARLWLAQARAAGNAQQHQAILILSAAIELEEGRPEAALDILTRLGRPPDPVILVAAAAIEGRALFQLSQVEAAVAVLVERELWLNDSAEVMANHELIWKGLREQTVSRPLGASGDPVIDGWLALQPVASAYRSDPAGLELGLLGWRKNYPNHPAATTFLSELLERNRLAQIYPRQLALLLPLSSRREQAAAIRDGFIAAHLRTNGKGLRAHIKVYDTDILGSEQAYLRAQIDGADFIVGPLLKPNVERIAGSASLTPTLALNFAQSETPVRPNFYQFALAPEDEAVEIARHAAAKGAVNAVALIPDSDWGIRLLNSFRNEFERLGGELLQFRGYDPDSQDYSLAITTLLNLTRSNQRYRRLAANISIPLEFEPRRRQDVDVIFIATDANNGRLLAPQLRFHYAGDLPTYATSEVYDPANGAGDADLNGILFPDSPWLLSPDVTSAKLKQTLATYWPQRVAQWPRLFAMGFDAYRLIPLLYHQTGRFTAIPAMSGELSLDSDGRVHRRLPLAQFRNGRPVALRSLDDALVEAPAKLANLR
ncbi:MAG: penicillin-binding protein activator [Gammaproteobacteria bacterium]|nr:penicillin-binding protein activator [Gammaproteobacteria bacterium]